MTVPLLNYVHPLILSLVKDSKGKYGISTRLICALLAAYFLNFSIDTSDLAPDSIPEDLSVNDIESVAEFVAEEVLDYNNTFTEHDERDAEDKGVRNFGKLFCPLVPQLLLKCHLRISSNTGTPIPDENFPASRCCEVASPPPRA